MDTGCTIPIAPASDTAATSSGFVHGYMAPQMMGWSMPTWRVNAVGCGFIARSPAAKAKLATRKFHVDMELMMYFITAKSSINKISQLWVYHKSLRQRAD